MFAKLSSIVSGDNSHVNALYDEVTRRFAPVLPKDPHVLTMFFILQRAADRVYYGGGRAAPVIQVNVKSIGYDEMLKFMDLHSGYMRRAAQLGFVSNFEYLDNLAHQIFPETAGNSLELFASDEGAMTLVKEDIRNTWAGLTLAYITMFLSIGSSETWNQQRLNELMSSAGQREMQLDVDVILRGDPMGVAS